MKKMLLGLLMLPLVWCSSCVMMQKSYTGQRPNEHVRTDIPVFTQEPGYRNYEEVSQYEAVGSNITSFDRVLARIKHQAKRDGCQALVRVQFFRQPIGNGINTTSFPTIRAVGVRFTDPNKLVNN